MPVTLVQCLSHASSVESVFESGTYHLGQVGRFGSIHGRYLLRYTA